MVNLIAFLTDLNRFDLVNEAMAVYFRTHYPARPVVGLASLLRAVPIESVRLYVLATEH